MSVRAKLFLLLLALSVLPIVLLRLNAMHTRTELTDELVRHSQHVLVAKAKTHMLTIVQDHAMLWRREGLFLEQTLRLQALEVEKALPKGDPKALIEAYRSAYGPKDERLSGQITVFEDGRISALPEDLHLPRRFDARQAVWYRLALSENGMVWTSPVVDPVTRRLGITLSMPVRDPAGRVAGVTALTAPFFMGGHTREHLLEISPHLKSYLIDFEDMSPDGKGFRIVGQEDASTGRDEEGSMHHMGRGMGMLGLSTPRWLAPDDPAELAAIAADLKNGMGDVRQSELDARDCIWAYAPAGVKGLALVLVAPKHDVTADAALAGEYIERRLQEQWRATLYMLVAGLMVVTLAAWLLSRSFTRPIVELSRASARLGEGDFGVRVTPSGGRELSEMGRIFNAMVPQLKDRTRLAAAMALAQEVHHRLLPAELPQVAGLDLAAVSISSEEVGGDSFDVVPGAHGHPDRVVALVGDVSGHGLDAALLMATARAFLRMRANQPGSPAEAVTDVNRLLAMDTVGSGRFMTLFYLEADPRTQSMRWVRAGHDPAILYNRAEDSFEELGGPGIPLGVLEDRTFAQSSRAWLRPGDVLLIGSDGMWEARGPGGDMFGKERVREILRASSGLAAKGVLEALMAALDAFREGSPAEDDVTLLVLKASNTEDV